jgi:N-acetylglucosamine kinase-like BadF-type ATPase
MPAAPAYALDAGGSHTLVRVRRADGQLRSWNEPSCAIAAAGERVAAARLRRTLARVRAELAAEPVLRGCIASSSCPVAGEAPPPEALVQAITGSECPGPVVLVNDVVPLLWSAHLGGHGVVVNSGTGSSVIGRGAPGRLLKLGGHEHIVSDQGSAYSLAREGLRAAARAADRLGPPTCLLTAAEAFYRRPVPALGRWLAELTRPRSEVARFAAEVLAADEQGDAVAAGIVAAEAAALSQAAVAAVSRLGLGRSPAIGLSGGVLCGSGRFRALVTDGIAEGGLSPRIAVLSSTDEALAFADLTAEGAAGLLAETGGLGLTVA